MPKKRNKDNDDDVTDISDNSESYPEFVTKQEPLSRPASVVGAPKVKNKLMSFSRYVQRSGIKPTHIPGLRAYAGNTNILRTKEAWDKLFEGY